MVIENGKYKYLNDFALRIAEAAIPGFQQRTPERVAEFAADTAKQIIDRCHKIKMSEPIQMNMNLGSIIEADGKGGIIETPLEIEKEANDNEE